MSGTPFSNVNNIQSMVHEAQKNIMSWFAGYARTAADCNVRGVSVVQDQEDFYTAALMAHELGHRYGL